LNFIIEVFMKRRIITKKPRAQLTEVVNYADWAVGTVAFMAENYGFEVTLKKKANYCFLPLVIDVDFMMPHVTLPSPPRPPPSASICPICPHLPPSAPSSPICPHLP
jgi:hypothetical protein